MEIRTFRALAGKNRYALFAAACLIPATCIQTAWAAEQQPEEVVVTGSRIRQSPVEQTAPVQTATSADIDRSGEISVADYLQRLPISGSAINRSNNASGNLGFPPDGGGIGAGASEIDLRYLTSKRVLVLVDGKRWVRGSSASGVSGAVDLNTIPTAAIERIEVLQDGASPIYGSDAIAGVVNVITKTDAQGFEFETNQAAYDEGDGYTQDYNLSWGAKAEKTRTFLSVGYSRQDPVMSGDRDLSKCVVFGASPCNFGGSGGVPQGRFIFLDPRGDVDGDGEPDVLDITLNNGASGANYDPNNPASGDYHAFAAADRFNFRPFNYLTTPNRRLNVFGKSAYDIADNVELTFTASFTNRRSHNQAAPNPLFMGSDAGAGFYLDNVFIPADQPFNPFGIDLDGRNNLITIGRRPVEAGPRIFDQNVDSWMLSGGLNGNFDLGSRTHYWDVSLNWGRNDASQTGHNIFQARKLALALGPEDECLAVPGCVPFNIFGGVGTITPEMLQWATYTQNDHSDQELNDVALNLSGELFDLPAGAFGYAVGFEYRKEEGSFTPDSVAQAGETADVPASPTAGEITVKEAYLELRAPLLANIPGIQRLELSGAVRSSDYDTFGRDEVYKAGIYWRVFNDLSVRANWAEGFRAPNIGELFNTGSRFDSSLDDPCDRYLTLNPGATASCQALGVPGTFTQLNPQISVQTGGNRDLTPETSETYTFGLGYSPAWARNASWIDELTFDVNYYNIKLDNAIQALDAQVQLDSCVATLSPTFCDGIVRAGGGAIVAFANQLTNIGRIETDGIDWTITLSTPEASFGALRFTWANTYLGGYKEFTFGENGLVGRELAGIELGSPTRGYVRYKSTLATDWQFREFVTSLTLRYLSAIDGSCTANARAQNLCSDPARGIDELDAKVYADLQVAWTPSFFDQKLQLALGINNILDEDPPPCRACDLNNYDGTLYPVPGRFIHARAAVKF